MNEKKQLTIHSTEKNKASKQRKIDRKREALILIFVIHIN